MKTIIIAFFISLFWFGTAFGQEKTETFTVGGSCGMCESRIENAAKSVEGVTKADYDLQTKMLEVVYDESKTDLDKIQEAIAKVGHDAGKHEAEDKVYNALPGCCKYR